MVVGTETPPFWLVGTVGARVIHLIGGLRYRAVINCCSSSCCAFGFVSVRDSIRGRSEESGCFSDS